MSDYYANSGYILLLDDGIIETLGITKKLLYDQCFNKGLDEQAWWYSSLIFDLLKALAEEGVSLKLTLNNIDIICKLFLVDGEDPELDNGVYLEFDESSLYQKTPTTINTILQNKNLDIELKIWLGFG